MVYIYKKKIGNKIRYYLRASKREGSKIVTKDIAYLGDDVLKLRENLFNLDSYKKEIRKSYRKLNVFLESTYYLDKVKSLKLKKNDLLKDNLLDLEACKLHYSEKIISLDEKTKTEIFNNFLVEFCYNTTSIEGNTISLEEARVLLDEGFTPANKTLREIHDINNSKNVFLNWMKYSISNKGIQDLHKSLVNGIDDRVGYRLHDVRVFKSRFKSTPAIYVHSDMDSLIEWFKQNKKKLHPFVLAVMFHHKFEKIHPFMDGNGRTGRMLLNFILMKFGYPPLLIEKKNRNEYLTALSFADDGDYSKLIDFCINSYIFNYWNLFL